MNQSKDIYSVDKFHNSKIILSLINTSYSRFKEKYPDEEPFWKISCFKKIHRRQIASDADMKMNWRSIETTNECKTSPLISEIKESRIVKETRNRVVTKHQEVKKWIEHDSGRGKIIKTKPIIVNDVTSISHSEETFLSDANPISVDINMKYDDPGFITIHKLSEEVKIIEEKIAMWGNDFNGTIITNANVSDGGLLSAVESHKNDIMRLRERIIELEIKNNDYLTLIANYQQERVESKNAEINFDRLNKVIKKKWTIGEVITKYAETQEKLNDAKMSVTNTLQKHTKLDINGLYKKYGFIGSFKHIVQYFDSQYDSSDEYDGSDADF